MLIAIRDGVYQDAINLVDVLSSEFSTKLFREGDVYNIARRNALSYPYFLGCIRTKHIPDHHIQAVESGTGAIAAYETNRALIESESFTPKITRIHIVQNSPFTPISDAWNFGMTMISELSKDEVDARLSKVKAKVLSNIRPPYAVTGGIRDILMASKGCAYSVSNQEVEAAEVNWAKVDDIDLDPASLVAIADLKQALSSDKIRKGESIMLHITGGGLNRAVVHESLKIESSNVVVEKSDYPEAIELVRKYLSYISIEPSTCKQ